MKKGVYLWPARERERERERETERLGDAGYESKMVLAS
jgi:hypothetical protein